MKAAVYDVTGPPYVFRYEDVPDPGPCRAGVVLDEAISIEGGVTLTALGGEMTRTAHRRLPVRGHIREIGAAVTDRKSGIASSRSCRRFARGARRGAGGRDLAGSGRSRSQRGCVRSLAWAPPTTASSSSDGCSRARPCSSRPVRAVSAWRRSSSRKCAGVTVLSTASSEERLEASGADSVWTTASTTPTTFGATVARDHGGRGVDLVVDSVGGKILAGSVQCLAYPGGRCVNVGSAGRDDSTPRCLGAPRRKPVAHRRVPRRRGR